MPSSRIARQKHAAGKAIFAPMTSLDTANDVLDAQISHERMRARTDVTPNQQLELDIVPPHDDVHTMSNVERK